MSDQKKNDHPLEDMLSQLQDALSQAVDAAGQDQGTSGDEQASAPANSRSPTCCRCCPFGMS